MLPKSFDKRARSADDHTPRPDIVFRKIIEPPLTLFENDRQRPYYICIASNNLLIGDWRLLFLLSQVMERAIFHSDNCYLIPNIRVRGYVCKTNIPSNTAFRGFGGPQVCMACACVSLRRWKAFASFIPKPGLRPVSTVLRKKVRFLKMDNVLKLNFQVFILKPCQFPLRKTRKPRGWYLKDWNPKPFSRVACPRNPLIRGRPFHRFCYRKTVTIFPGSAPDSGILSLSDFGGNLV